MRVVVLLLFLFYSFPLFANAYSYSPNQQYFYHMGMEDFVGTGSIGGISRIYSMGLGVRSNNTTFGLQYQQLGNSSAFHLDSLGLFFVEAFSLSKAVFLGLDFSLNNAFIPNRKDYNWTYLRYGLSLYRHNPLGKNSYFIPKISIRNAFHHLSQNIGVFEVQIEGIYGHKINTGLTLQLVGGVGFFDPSNDKQMSYSFHVDFIQIHRPSKAQLREQSFDEDQDFIDQYLKK
jgi:hypothetical protein